jgi:Uma2 family endonuclease
MTTTLLPFEPEIQEKRFSVVEYDRMIRGGYLDDMGRLELIEGRILIKMPHNAPHDHSVYQLQTRLLFLLHPEWVVRGQSSVTFDTSVPEPDLAIVPGPPESYSENRPTASDVVFVVEVSDTTLRLDQTTKLVLYARNKIPIYWIVNLRDQVITVYTQPRAGRTPGYRKQTDFTPGSAVPVVIGKKTIGSILVNEILP